MYSANGSGSGTADNVTRVKACLICKKLSSLKCSKCREAFYCSAEHQRLHWKQHKLNCLAFEVARNEKLGRHLVACRDIRAGEVVLREKPLVRGPSQVTCPVCIVCLQGLSEDDIKSSNQQCQRCGWPLCKECNGQANSKPLSHSECDLTASRGNKLSLEHYCNPHPTYQCLAVLRCLLLKESEPELYERLTQLESHCDARRGSLQWHNDREGTAKFIARFFKVPTRWSEDEILRMCGIVQTNGHEVPLTEPAHVAIYDRASLVEHSCAPNLTKSFTSNAEVVLWAPNAIKKGDHLSICYSDALWGTPNRQNHLHQTKMFRCDCVRCADTTEFGTYFSAIKCNGIGKCRGLLLPASADGWNASWTCNLCLKSVEQTYLQSLLEHIEQDRAEMDKSDANQCISFIEQYSKWLPPNHYALCDVELTLTQAIGEGGPTALQTVDDRQLQMKIDVCRKLLKVVKTLAAAESRCLGALYFELHSGLAEYGRRSLSKHGALFKPSIDESIDCGVEAVRFLQHEPAELSEGLVCVQARANIEALKMILCSSGALGS